MKAASSVALPGDLDPVLVGLVDEFSRRIENGEEVGVEEFARLHPDHAERLRTLLPAIRGLAALGRSATVAAAPVGGLDRGSLLGDYRIVREVGRGGMGVVYEAYQASLGRAVALKVLSRRGGPDFLERFRREAQVVARLHHPNIVPVFGIGEEQGVHFYTMQFIHGHNLDDVLGAVRRRPATSEAPTERGGPPVAEVSTGGVCHADLRTPGSAGYYRAVTAAAAQAAQGLAHAHGLGVLHRDVKPSNLLLDDSGIVRLTDFGLAKVEGDESLTHTGDVVGTLRYMAPERFEGHCDVRSDVYGLGMTLYELLTLRPAFDEPDRARLLHRIRTGTPTPPHAVRPDVPRDLETIVLKAIDPLPAARYQTAAALADDLQRYLDHRPIEARPPGWVGHVTKWARRRPAVAALTAAVGLAVVALLAVWVAYSLNLQSALHDKDVALHEKQHQWEVADAALAEKESGLYRAWLGEARALRFSGLVGWRRKALANLEKLAHSGVPEKDIVALRTEAVACLSTPDLRLEATLPMSDPLAIAYSPDGRLLAVKRASGETTLWDMQRMKAVRTLPGVPRRRDGRLKVGVVQFQPSGRAVAFADGAAVRVVPLDDTVTERPLLQGTADVLQLGFSRDGKRLAVVCADGQVTVHDLTTGKALWSVKLPPWSSKAVALSPDADSLAVGDADHDVLVYRFDRPGTPLLLGQHQAEITDLVFSPDGCVWSASQDGSVRRWNVDHPGMPGDATEVWTVPERSPHRLALSPDGQFLALVDTDPAGSLTLRDMLRGSPPLVSQFADDATWFAYTGNLAFSPAGDQLVVGREFGRGRGGDSQPQLQVFRVEGRREKRRLVGESGRVSSLAFHPRRPLAVTSESAPYQRLTFWDLAECRPVSAWPDQSARPGVLAFSPDGILLASLLVGQPGSPATLALREVEGGAIRHRVTVPGVLLSAFAPSGKTLAIATRQANPAAQLVPVVDGTLDLEPLPGGDVPRGAWLQFFDDGKRAVGLGAGSTAPVYDVASGARVGELQVGDLRYATLSKDGRLLLGMSPARNALVLYRFPEMVELGALTGGAEEIVDRVKGPPFSPDNRYIVLISSLQVPQLRSGRTLELLFSFPNHQKLITYTVVSHSALVAVLDRNTVSSVTLYDVLALRRGLAELGLDWSDDAP